MYAFYLFFFFHTLHIVSFFVGLEYNWKDMNCGYLLVSST